MGLKIVTFYIVIAAIVTGSHFCRYKVHFKERERMLKQMNVNLDAT